MRKIVAVSAATAALVLAGCSSTPAPPPAAANPKDAVTEAATNAGQGHDQTVTFRLDTTPEDIAKVVEASEASNTSDSSTTQMLSTLGKILPKTSMQISLHSDGAELNTEKDPAKIDAAFQLSVDGKPVDLTWLDSRAFLHADVEGLGQATGLFTGEQVRMAVADQAQSKPWITDLVNGKWVEADPASVQKLLQDAQASASPSAAPTVDPARARAAFLDNSEISKVDDDTYRVVTDAKKLIPSLAAIDPNDDLTEEKAQEAIDGLKDGANLDTTVDVADGKVTRAVVDLDDIARTWPKTDGDAQAEKLANTDFHADGVFEFSDANPNIAMPQATSTIPASDLEQLADR